MFHRRTVHCFCGECLMPSPDQKEMIKNRICIITDLLHVIKQGTRGERHGPEYWQHHHWKAEMPPWMFSNEDSQPSRRDGLLSSFFLNTNWFLQRCLSSRLPGARFSLLRRPRSCSTQESIHVHIELRSELRCQCQNWRQIRWSQVSTRAKSGNIVVRHMRAWWRV